MEVGISLLMAFEILNIGIVFLSARSTAPVHSHLPCMILVADPFFTRILGANIFFAAASSRISKSACSRSVELLYQLFVNGNRRMT